MDREKEIALAKEIRQRCEAMAEADKLSATMVKYIGSTAELAALQALSGVGKKNSQE